MEAMLLGFCLFSLILSSTFVAIELTRDHKRQKWGEPPKPKLKPSLSLSFKEITPVERPTKPERLSDQATGKVLDSLNHQLIALGYVSSKQQLGFVNRVLKSQRTQIDDIDPNEVRHLFKVIRRYTGPSVSLEAATPSSMPQVTSHI